MTNNVLTRRDVLGHLGLGSAAMIVGGCSQAAESRPNESDDAFLARLLSEEAIRIPARAKPYRITRTLLLPAGRTVHLATGVRICWEGPRGTVDQPVSVFRTNGDDCAIVADGDGSAHVECLTPRPYVYAIEMMGGAGLQVTQLQTLNCQHVRIHNPNNYAGVRTKGAGINVARGIRITGGGARFTKPQREGHGSCLLEFVVDCHVVDAQYENVGNGVQWWGGNADPTPGKGEGAAGNERKCQSITIERVTVNNCFAGIWGAMGRDIVVRDCRVDTAIDVCFDAEGCQHTLFERCNARNGYNGCFSTFFLCDGVRFIDCIGEVDAKSRPLFRVYNSTLSNQDNKALEIDGGHFECHDQSGPGVIDTAAGPVQNITIANATLVNVRIDTAHYNMHSTRIIGNTLQFPFALPSVAAIRAGASKTIDTPQGRVAGGVTILGNQIHYTATAVDGAAAIELLEDDFNAAAQGQIAGNVITGRFKVGVALTNASNNRGIRPKFDITGNQFTGMAQSAPLLRLQQSDGAQAVPDVRWDDRQTRDGHSSPLRDALR